MLTADLVRVRRRGDELQLIELRGPARARALNIAAALVEATLAHVGKTRREVGQAFDGVVVIAADKKLKAGLCKLLDEGCTYAVETELDPASLRSEVFLRASADRASIAPGQRFDRRSVLQAVADQSAVEPERVEKGLFADLRVAHVLESVEPMTAEQLVTRHEMSQAQAVLLRAVSVCVTVSCRNAYAYRELFRQLKFRQLLYTLHATDDGGYQIAIDGPFSLFESVTKYGLRLALVLPAIQACDRWQIVADVRWGKQREKRMFRQSGSCANADASPPSRSRKRAQILPDELEALVAAVARRDGAWQVGVAAEILDLPGCGLCVPDLVFTHVASGFCVYFELMGFWSRAAVWRRVELVQNGLAKPILFAVSRRLRVSEEVLDATEVGALYEYSTRLDPAEIEIRLERLRQRNQNAST